MSFSTILKENLCEKSFLREETCESTKSVEEEFDLNNEYLENFKDTLFINVENELKELCKSFMNDLNKEDLFDFTENILDIFQNYNDVILFDKECGEENEIDD